MKRFIKYPGSKYDFIDKINEIINQSTADIYIEPFLGSGAVFFNLQKEFKQYYLNDIDRNLLRIYVSFRDGNYSDFKSFYDSNIKKYGNWGKEKESYYKFRDEMNSKLFMSDSIEEGYFIYIISNSCINSLMRFGPSGFNQGWGDRGKENYLSEEEFNAFKNKLQKTIITNKSYEYCFDNNIENSLYFLDPPYVDSKHDYGRDFNQIDFINKIKYSNDEIIYTDMYSDFVKNQLLTFNSIKLRDMQKVAPSKNLTEIKEDFLFYNFDVEFKNNIFFEF